MTIVRRNDIKAPELPQETVEVPALGGEVTVRAMTLTERLAFGGQAGERERVPVALLAMCVLADDGLPLFDAAGWDSFGAANMDQAMTLVDVAMRLSGLTGDAKNA